MAPKNLLPNYLINKEFKFCPICFDFHLPSMDCSPTINTLEPNIKQMLLDKEKSAILKKC